MLIALAGLAGAGKSTVVDWLERRGAGVRIYVGSFVTAEVSRRGLAITPANEKRIRDEIRSDEGMEALARRALPAVRDVILSGRTALIDAIYCAEERAFYEQDLAGRLVCLAIETSAAIRAARLARRNDRPMSPGDLSDRDAYELDRLGLGTVLSTAQHTLSNDGTLGDLEETLQRFLISLGN